jgi:hypothetical protein
MLLVLYAELNDDISSLYHIVCDVTMTDKIKIEEDMEENGPFIFPDTKYVVCKMKINHISFNKRGCEI